MVMDNNRYKGSWLYALVFSAGIIMIFNPMASVNTEIQEFSRSIGEGIVSGYDVTRVVGNFNKWFLAFAVLVIASLQIFSYIRNREYGEQEREAWKLLDGVMILAAVNLVFRAITFFYDEASGEDGFYYSSFLIALVIVFILVYIISRLGRWIDFSTYFFVLVIVYAAGYPLVALLKTAWLKEETLFIVQALLCLIAVCVMLLLAHKKVEIPHRETVISSTMIVASALPSLLFLTMEFIYITAARGIYIISFRKTLLLVLIVAAAAFVLLTKVLIDKESKFDAKKIAYPLLIFGVVALYVQAPLTTTYSSDMFERANASILITDFFYFGKVPIVSHYGGHMMLDVWEGLLYAVLNNDILGSTFLPYSGFFKALVILLFYFVIKNIFDEKEALLITLLFPFCDFIDYFGQGFYIILAILAFTKKNSYPRALLIWLACIWCAFYRLDVGYAFDVACVFALVCYIVAEKNKKAIKPLLVTFASCVFVLLAAWILLCIGAGANPVDRLLEFLRVSLSNQNWARYGIGDVESTAYAWCYLLTPVVVEGTLLYVLISKDFRKKAGPLWYVLIVLGAAYFVNFSRGLVRHSVAEGSFYTVFWSSLIYLALFAAVKYGKRVFLPTLTAVILLMQLFSTDEIYTEVAVADDAGSNLVTNITNIDANWPTGSATGEAVRRVVIDESVINHLEPLRLLVEVLLEEDETYVDFMNHTFSYSYLGKEDPMYITQSPLQLAGEETQEQLIAEISENLDENPIVILPYDNLNCSYSSSMEDIANNVRNYKVAEYIYQNFVPLCHYGEYAVWCTADRYDDMLEKISSYIDSEATEDMDIDLIDYGSDCYEVLEDGKYIIDSATSLHVYDLKRLAIIWAELDAENAADNDVAATVSGQDGVYSIADVDQIDKSDGNYLLMNITCEGVSTEEDMTATVRMGEMQDGRFVEKCSYTMELDEGTHQYLIRISEDYFWYTDDVDTIVLESDEGLLDVSMSVLCGD